MFFVCDLLFCLQYQYSSDPLAEHLFPGKVHSGVFDIFKMTYAEIEQASDHVRGINDHLN
jgi:hypothetical protein